MEPEGLGAAEVVEGVGEDCEGAGFGASEGEGDIEQQLCGTIPFGEDTPAMSEPKPSFCSVSASSFPVVSNPFAAWNRCTASTVSGSIFPLDSPL